MGDHHRMETAALTADVVVFRVQSGRLEVLLIQRGNPPFQGRWALPGGFVDPGEDPEPAARRELLEETCLTAPWLLPVGGYGDAGRDPRGRTVTLTYLTVMDDAAPVAGDDAAGTQWWDARDPPPLAFDHALMLTDALARLRAAVADPEVLPRLAPMPLGLHALASRLEALVGFPVSREHLAGRLTALGHIPRARQNGDLEYRIATLSARGAAAVRLPL